jgi:uncharacterized repeat protein (TIGR01451 family)
MDVNKFLIYLILFSILFSPSKAIVGQVFSNNLFQVDIESTIKTDLITIDVNGDGDLDIIHRGQELILYLNMGNFSYEEQGAIYDGSSGSVDFYDVLDYNLDGLVDLLFLGFDNYIFEQILFVLVNKGDGTFTLEPIKSLSGIIDQSPFDVGDFDNDGDFDFVLGGTIDQQIHWYENKGNGMFENFQTNNISIDVDFVKEIKLLDVNNDSFLDVVLIYESSVIRWFENDSNLNFIDFEAIFDNPSVSGNITSEFIDYDSDGDLDVIVAVDDTGLIGWLVNEDGAFFDLTPFDGEPISNVTSISVGDVNNDGDEDLVLGGEESIDYELRLYSNIGVGDFDFSVISDVFDRICFSKLVDLNNDSYLDFLFAYIENSIDLKYGIIPNALGAPSLNGCIFFDENMNGIKDKNEQNLDGFQVDLEPDMVKLQTNEDGCYTFFVDNGAYTVSPNIPSIWELTTDSATYTVTVNGGSQSNLDFGFASTQQLLAGQMHAVSGITRCNRETKFDFNFQNMGTTVITEGIVWAFPDDLVSLAGEIDAIDTIGVTGEWGWTFENLYPGQTVQKSILLNIPGLGVDIEPGTLIKIFSATQATDTQGFTNFFKHNFESEILCAYDPNDKLVKPDREGDENYTQFKDTMIYTVRFQNTGNDTAFTVVIRDTLDLNLDVSTFNILGSSHREVLTTEILEDQFISFSFDDILLPDSTIDFIGSQGYVSYSIEPKDGIVENTIIENTASIYFDFNPPIVTNTTQNTMVECLPITPTDVSVIIEAGESYTLPDGTIVDQSGIYTTQFLDEDDCPLETILTVIEVLTSNKKLTWNQYVDISPNPAEGYFNLDIKSNTTIAHELVIFNIFGEEILKQKINEPSSRIGIQNLIPGTYMVQLTNLDKELMAIKKLVVL